MAQTPLAFPGAEGFGKNTTGGRGGRVLVVSNLNDNGPGSFRDAVLQSGPRTIIFFVSGTIALESSIVINDGDLTIAGQSAPGDGICIRNFPVIIQADNVIVRFIRFRMGDEMKQQADALSGSKRKSNIIIDHCSISWATDECASFYRNKNFTLQWCIISESLNQSVHEKGNHGYGGIWGGEGATFHHNLLAHHTSRLPRFSGSSTTPNSPEELVDFRYNVIYNWGSNNTYGGEKGRYNMVGNYYKPGPASKGAKGQIVNATSPVGKFYLADNILFNNDAVTKNNKVGVKTSDPDSAVVTTEFPVVALSKEKTESAFNRVLKTAGASLHRDAIDVRVVEEVRTGKASLGRLKNGIIDSQTDAGGWPLLRSLTPEPDSDGDGIPDKWELKHKLDPKNKQDASGKSIHKDYDNLEVYLNSLVEKVMMVK
jgi:hypothetical protein